LAEKPRRRRLSSEATEAFFTIRDPQNKHKTEIIEHFFKAYCSIILTRTSEIDYIDLYAGRGFYDSCGVDPSILGPVDATPLRILRAVIQNRNFSRCVTTWFNEADADYVRNLRAAVAGLDGIAALAHAPRITDFEVSDEMAAQFRPNVPTFFFFDPYGYVGITQRLLRSALTKSWGDAMSRYSSTTHA